MKEHSKLEEHSLSTTGMRPCPTMAKVIDGALISAISPREIPGTTQNSTTLPVPDIQTNRENMEIENGSLSDCYMEILSHQINY